MDSSWQREDCDFDSDGERCAAWLYRPTDAGEDPPIVVMAHGFAGERAFRLPDYAMKFAASGMAVLLFDYRHFGDSEGQPRNLIDHRRQTQDWSAAIAHSRTIAGVDGHRIGLWGSSFSGGHVVAAAADHSIVRAITAQAPMLNIPRSLRIGVKFALAAFWHASRDYLRAMMGRSPHYIPVVAPPNRFAALNQPGCDTGYRAILPPDHVWKNECTARTLLHSILFRPSRKASKVKCPSLFIVAQHDQVIRARFIEKVASGMRQAEIVRFPLDHFQVYQGDAFEQISLLQADFFRRHLGISSELADES